MEPTWEDYLLRCGDADLTRLLNEWRWLVSHDYMPILVTALGDMFLAHANGRIFWLDTYEGSFTEVAIDYEALKATMVQPQLFQRWFLPHLIEQLKEQGITRESTQCYSPLVPPVFGGEMVPSNFHAVAPVVHFAFCGQIHQKVKDLPPGTPINGLNLIWE